MNEFNAQLTGRIALAIAVLAVVAIVALTLLYSGLPFFGPVNDLTNAAGALCVAALVWQFHAVLRERAPFWAWVALVAAAIGALAIIVNSILVALGRMHWMTGGMYTAIGYGLIGLWLLSMIRIAQPQPYLTSITIRLGIVAGVGMLFGLLAGPAFPSSAAGQISPLVWASFVGAGAGYLLFPLWCWLLSRNLLS